MLSIDISNISFDNLLDFVTTKVVDYRNFEFVLIFKADYNQSKMIRDLTIHLFEKNNINVPWKNRFALVSDELVNNAIEYGSLPLDKNLFKIKFNEEDGKLAVNLEVYDTGKWPQAKTSSEMEVIRQSKEQKGFDGYLGKRGRWLFQLVSNLVDDLYFRDNPQGGLIVGVSKKLELETA